MLVAGFELRSLGSIQFLYCLFDSIQFVYCLSSAFLGDVRLNLGFGLFISCSDRKTFM